MSKNIIALDIREKSSLALLATKKINNNLKIIDYYHKVSDNTSRESILNTIDYFLSKFARVDTKKLNNFVISLPNGVTKSIHGHISKSLDSPEALDSHTIFSPELHQRNEVINEVRYNQVVDGNYFSTLPDLKGREFSLDIHQEIVDKAFYDRITQKLNSYGVRNFQIVNRAFAAILSSTYFSDRRAAASLNFGYSSSTIAIVLDNAFIDSFTLPFGIKNYVDSVVEKFKIEEQDAISLLKGVESLKGSNLIKVDGNIVNYSELCNIVSNKNRAVLEALLSTRLSEYIQYIDSIVLTGQLIPGLFTEILNNIEPSVVIGFPTNIKHIPEELFSFEDTPSFGIVLERQKNNKNQNNMTFSKIFDKIKSNVSKHLKFKENV